MSGWLPANIAGGINTLASRAKEYAEAALSEDGTGDAQRHANYSLGGMGSNGFAKKNEDYVPVPFDTQGDVHARLAELEALNHNLRVE
ncbi:hypothetical protein HK097_011347, partial [Rhizophlyctis rosea]